MSSPTTQVYGYTQTLQWRMMASNCTIRSSWPSALQLLTENWHIVLHTLLSQYWNWQPSWRWLFLYSQHGWSFTIGQTYSSFQLDTPRTWSIVYETHLQNATYVKSHSIENDWCPSISMYKIWSNLSWERMTVCASNLIREVIQWKWRLVTFALQSITDEENTGEKRKHMWWRWRLSTECRSREKQLCSSSVQFHLLLFCQHHQCVPIPWIIQTHFNEIVTLLHYLPVFL